MGPADDPPSSELGRSIDSYLNDLVRVQLFQGSVLVAHDGEVLLARGYGQADIEHNLPNTAHTRFRLASVTKPLTALAIMQLQAIGRLDVEDPLCRYIRDCPAAWSEIRLSHLLTHSSGIPDYGMTREFEQHQSERVTPAQLLERFRDMPLEFEPGSRYRYGNSGYVLLGMVIERVTGQSYTDWMNDRLFKPLEMNDSGLCYAPRSGGIEAVGYMGMEQQAPPLDTSNLYAAGGSYSTVLDLYRLDQALYDDTLLPSELRDEIFTPRVRDYGYGWQIKRYAGYQVQMHTGTMDGFEASLIRVPEARVTIVLLANMTWADIEGISAYLTDVVLASV